MQSFAIKVQVKQVFTEGLLGVKMLCRVRSLASYPKATGIDFSKPDIPSIMPIVTVARNSNTLTYREEIAFTLGIGSGISPKLTIDLGKWHPEVCSQNLLTLRLLLRSD